MEAGPRKMGLSLHGSFIYLLRGRSSGGSSPLILSEEVFLMSGAVLLGYLLALLSLIGGVIYALKGGDKV